MSFFQINNGNHKSMVMVAVNINIFSDFTICLNGLTVHSSGITKKHQPELLGKYYYYKESRKKQSFIHSVNRQYLYWAPDSKWKVCNNKNVSEFIQDDIFLPAKTSYDCIHSVPNKLKMRS